MSEINQPGSVSDTAEQEKLNIEKHDGALAFMLPAVFIASVKAS